MFKVFLTVLEVPKNRIIQIKMFIQFNLNTVRDNLHFLCEMVLSDR